MATELERLMVRLEVSQRKFEKQLAAAGKTADARSKQIENRFAAMNKNISKGFGSISKSASSSFGSVKKLALSALGALGTREIARYADAWTSAGNQIRTAAQISGTASRSLGDINDIATEARSGLTETVDLYSRLLRVSGNLSASEEEVAQATEIVAKAFKAGGAAASEQASGILQLGQALGSGFLQGDELRSLRENAPLVAQAIADEFGVTIGGLKDLGAEGELTAERVFRGILNAQGKIDAAFDVTNATIGEGFTLVKNALTELVGAFNEGSGATEGITQKLGNLGQWLTDNTEAARRFGAQVSEAVAVVGEVVDSISGKISGAVGDEFDVSAKDVTAFVTFVVDALQTLISEASGVGAAIARGVLVAVQAVADGGVAIANAAISAVESILNGIIDGIDRLIYQINKLIASANEISPVAIPMLSGPQRVSLGRAEAPDVSGGISPSDSYRNTKDAVRAALEGAEDAVVGTFRRVSRAGATGGEVGDPRGPFQLPPVQTNPTSTTAPTTPTDGDGSGKKGGGSAKEKTGLFDDIEKQKAALQDQIAMIGMSSAAAAELTAKTELLNEAKERGIDVDARAAGSGETVREQIDRQAASIGELTARYEQAKEQADFFEQTQEQIKDGFIDAIVEGENLAGVMEDLAKSIAKAALQALLFGDGPLGGILGGASGGGLLGGAVGSLLSFGGGGFTGGGVRAGGIDGKGGFPAILHPNETIIDHSKGGGGGGGSMTIFVRPSADLIAEARSAGEQRSIQVVQENNRKVVPRIANRQRTDPRRVG